MPLSVNEKFMGKNSNEVFKEGLFFSYVSQENGSPLSMVC